LNFVGKTTIRSPAIAIRRGLKLFDSITDSRIRLGDSGSRMLMMVKTKRKWVKLDNRLAILFGASKIYFWVLLIGDISISIFIIYNWM
jgi:hypothetical protein